MTINEFLKSLSDFMWTFGWIGSFFIFVSLNEDDKDKKDGKK